MRYNDVVRRKGDEFGFANINERLGPVRAVEQYFHTTRDSKSSFSFVNPGNRDNVLKAKTASNLVESLVKLADPSANFSVKNTRDFASTQGWLFGATCTQLQASCHWASLWSFA